MSEPLLRTLEAVEAEIAAFQERADTALGYHYRRIRNERLYEACGLPHFRAYCASDRTRHQKSEIYNLIKLADRTDEAIERGEEPPASIREALGTSNALDTNPLVAATDSDHAFNDTLNRLRTEYGDDLRPTDLNAVHKRVVRRKREEAARALRETVVYLPRDDVRIEHCDFRELEIDDASIDLGFTDPPYGKRHHHLWDDLGEFAARMLKPGAPLVTYCGNSDLPFALNALSRHLDFVGSVVIACGGTSYQDIRNQINHRIKPLLIFSKGPYEPKNWIADVFHEKGPEKEFHPWQQSLDCPLHYIGLLTNPGEVVLDCFLGSGTFGVAAHRLRREFVGCDIDAEAVAIAKARIMSEKIRDDARAV